MRGAKRGVLGIAAAALVCGCQTGHGAVADALVNTALAAGASGVRRASGDCYSPCAPGTRCNRSTGYCEPLPCRGQCQPWERCDESGLFARCVPGEEAPLEIGDEAQAGPR